MIVAFFQADTAFIWGIAVIFLAGFGWLMSIAGLIQLHKIYKNRGAAA